ncbi:MAG: GNAT family N-acetyltransferase [Hyphomicrobium sp.]|nr:GNAT family N-acetyltransferase [Hyphomicrobium sp.]
MTLTIRPLQAADAAAWDAMFRAYIAFYETEVPDAIIALTWQRVLTQTDHMCGLIAIDETGQALGLANLVFHASTWSATSYCYLEDLFVSPLARGRGVGRALIDATYAEADRRGASRTYWATQTGNATARRLYDDIGTLTDFVQYRRDNET